MSRMSMVYCGECSTRQPVDWQPGDSCIACSVPVRKDVRCGWCAELTPDGQFCRHCGNSLQDDALFGVARILKSLGVNQFELSASIEALPAPKVDLYQQAFNRHYRIVERVLIDARRQLPYLQLPPRNAQAAIEKALLEQIPFDDKVLDKQSRYLADTPPNQLIGPAALELSPLTIEVANIAWARRNWSWSQDAVAKLLARMKFQLLEAPDWLAQEYGLLFNHPPLMTALLFMLPASGYGPSPFERDPALYDAFRARLRPLLSQRQSSGDAAVAWQACQQFFAQADDGHSDAVRYQVEMQLDDPRPERALAAAIASGQPQRVAYIARGSDRIAYYALDWVARLCPEFLKDVFAQGDITLRQFQKIQSGLSWAVHKEPPPYKMVLAQALYRGLSGSDLYTDAASVAEIGNDQELARLRDKAISYAGQYFSWTQRDVEQMLAHCSRLGRPDLARRLLRGMSDACGIGIDPVRRYVFQNIVQGAEQDLKASVDQIVSLMMSNHYPDDDLLAALFQTLVQYYAEGKETLTSGDSLGNLLRRLLCAPQSCSMVTLRFLIQVVTGTCPGQAPAMARDYAKMCLRKNVMSSRTKYHWRGELVGLDDTEALVASCFDGDWEDFIKRFCAAQHESRSARDFRATLLNIDSVALGNFLATHPLSAERMVQAMRYAWFQGWDDECKRLAKIQDQNGVLVLLRQLVSQPWDEVTFPTVMLCWRAVESDPVATADALKGISDWMRQHPELGGKERIFHSEGKTLLRLLLSRTLPQELVENWVIAWQEGYAIAADLDEICGECFRLDRRYREKEGPIWRVNGEVKPLILTDLVNTALTSIAAFVELWERTLASGRETSLNHLLLVLLTEGLDALMSGLDATEGEGADYGDRLFNALLSFLQLWEAGDDRADYPWRRNWDEIFSTLNVLRPYVSDDFAWWQAIQGLEAYPELQCQLEHEEPPQQLLEQEEAEHDRELDAERPIPLAELPAFIAGFTGSHEENRLYLSALKQWQKYPCNDPSILNLVLAREAHFKALVDADFDFGLEFLQALYDILLTQDSPVEENRSAYRAMVVSMFPRLVKDNLMEEHYRKAIQHIAQPRTDFPYPPDHFQLLKACEMMMTG